MTPARAQPDATERLILHFPSIIPIKGVSWLSCACEEFDRQGEWAMVVKAWALHVAALRTTDPDAST